MTTELKELVDRYPITVFWSEEDESYIAICTAFSGHSALGETPEEALREGRIALEGFIESYIELGDPLPNPSAVAA